MTNLSNIVEILAKQALGNSSQSNQQGGLGGILGSVLGQLGGAVQQPSQSNNAAGGSNASALLIAVLPLVLAWIQKQGGLQGALDQLRGQGISSQVDDWVSTGPGENAAVNPQQVQSLFDEADIEQIAQETQAPKLDIYSAISSVLPQIIDSLTPQGSQTSNTEANADIQQVMSMVAGFLKR